MSVCLRSKTNTENVHPEVLNTKNDRTMLSSKCDVLKKKEAKGIFRS